MLTYIAALALVAGALFGAYHHGMTVTDATWQAEWNARDTRDTEAKAANEAAEREKELARQQAINKAIQDGQQIIDKVTADATAERASRSGLQLTVDDLARRRAAMVLADVFKRADSRAGDLAVDADQRRSRGVTCEQAFNGL
jgi:hypothetical protein